MADSLIKAWLLPHPALRPFVDRYWCSSGARGTPLPTLLPGTGVDLYFHLERPFAIIGSQNKACTAPQAHLNYMRCAPVALRADDDYAFVAVRFRSGALRNLCASVPECRLDEVIELTRLWGSEAESVTENLMRSVSLAACAPILDRWLLACLERYGSADRLIDDAANCLYYHHAGASIEKLAARYDLGRRQFERRFNNALGCSPKFFLCLARFQSSMRELLQQGRLSYTDTVLAHGYYDQAHFIHDFQRFVAEKPQVFLQRSAAGSHFYNPLPTRKP